MYFIPNQVFKVFLFDPKQTKPPWIRSESQLNARWLFLPACSRFDISMKSTQNSNPMEIQKLGFSYTSQSTSIPLSPSLSLLYKTKLCPIFWHSHLSHQHPKLKSMPPFLSSLLSPLPLENNQFLMTTDHYFTGGTGDADLEAVVRGYNHPQTCFSPLIFKQDDHDIVLSTFPDLFETSSTFFDELEELYKPFYPQSLISSSDSGTGAEREQREPEKAQDKESFCGPTTPVVAGALGVKQKRRLVGWKEL